MVVTKATTSMGNKFDFQIFDVRLREVDDALAARGARVPFVAILPPGGDLYRDRAARFRDSGALALLPRARDLDTLLRVH